MKMEVIMTISIFKEISNDVFANYTSDYWEIDDFDSKSKIHDQLCALTFVAKQSSPDQNLQELAEACGREAFLNVNLVFNDLYKGWIFVSDGPWKEKNRLVEYKKLWKLNRDIYEACGPGIKSDEILFENGSMVRFAGFLEITEDLVDKAIEMVRTHYSCAIIFSRREDIFNAPSITQVFSVAFPKKHGVPQTRIDWKHLAMELCPKGDILLRIHGRFDDPEAAADLIGAKENISLMY
jgi:hypothetical protein